MVGKLALLVALGLGAAGVLSAADVMRGDIAVGSVVAPSLVQAAKSLAEEIAAIRHVSDIGSDLEYKLNTALHYCKKVQFFQYGFKDVGPFRKVLAEITAARTDDSLARAVKVLGSMLYPAAKL